METTLSCAIIQGETMWGNKKPDKPPPAGDGLQNIKTNQWLKATPASSDMPSNVKIDATRPTGMAADRATARLGPNLHVKGEISGSEDLYVDGTVEGLIQLDDRKLTVGATAKLRADIIAGEVIVSGSVKGNVRAKKIEIKKEGSLHGDLTTAQIMIQDGAYFKGTIEIERSAEAEKEAEKNVFSPRSASAPPDPPIAGPKPKVSDQEEC
jgi:cytoskeletal protein CcmA (bactofilin family)